MRRLGKVVPPEQGEHVVRNEISESLKRWYDHIAETGTDLIERYRRLRLCIHLHVAVLPSSREPSSDVLREDLCVVLDWNEGSRNGEGPEPGGDHRTSEAHDDNADDLVLISIRDFMEHPERMHFASDGVHDGVRLQRLNVCNRQRVNPSERIASASPYVRIFQRVIEDRKSGAVVWLQPVGANEHQLPYEMVETGPEIVNNIPDDHAPTEREFWRSFSARDYLARLWVVIDHHTVEVVQPADDFGFEIDEMLIGPLDFGLASVEPVSHA